ncbi:MAG: ribosome silencing factor [Thermodesulfobacteriota bacterium]
MKQTDKRHAEKSSLELVHFIIQAAAARKAEDLLVLDVRGLSSLTDYFIIMSGRSTRHVQGLAESIGSELGKKRIKEATTEGLAEGHWVLLDYQDVVVHIFYLDERELYNLEGLWHDAPRLKIEAEKKI